MPEFAWRAAEASGRLAQGRLEAATLGQAVQQLKSRGLVPLAVDPLSAAGRAAAAALGAAPAALPSALPAAGGASRWRRRDPGVQPRDVRALTHELAVMLRAGLPLAYALQVLIEMTGKASVRALLQAVLDDVKAGSALSRALAAHGLHFGPFMVSMVRAGEASGQLPAMLERLAAHLARLAALRESVVSAAIYPAILLAVALLSLAGMLGFVVPQFERLFSDLGDALPLPTQLVLGLSHHLRDWGTAWLTAALAAGWLLWRWGRTAAGARARQRVLLALPLLGPLVRRFQLTVFARTLGTLVGAGVPLLAALDIAVDTVTSAPLREPLSGMATQVKSGVRLAPAMAATGQFEPLALNLVRVGEETGRLGAMLLELAALGDERIEGGIKRLLTLLEPALIVVLGIVIAGIIVSILLGILSVNDLAI